MEGKRIVSALEYAKHRGCSEYSVRDAIERGILKLSLSIDSSGTNKKYFIDVDAADEEWPPSPREMMARNKKVPVEEIVKKEIERENPPPAPAEKKKSSIELYNEARAAKEQANAKMAETKYMQLAGELAPVAEVKDEAFSLGRRLRDAFLIMPDRLSADLAAETNVFKVHKMLDKEIREILCILESIAPDSGPGAVDKK